MNAIERRALEYLAISGGVNLSVFLDDHEPIGGKLADNLMRSGYIEENLAGRLVLTNKGAAKLREPAP